MKIPKLPPYTRARILACRGRRITLHEDPSSRWSLIFVPLEKGRCREVALSISGEIREGFQWQWNGYILTIVPEQGMEEIFLLSHIPLSPRGFLCL